MVFVLTMCGIVTAATESINNPLYNDTLRMSNLPFEPCLALLVSHKYNLAICTPFKAASAQWRRLMFALQGLNFEGFGALSHTGTVAQRQALMPNGVVQERVMRLPGMRTALVIRDPLERLLSGYLEKCILHGPDEGPHSHCVNFRDTSPTLQQFLDELQHRAKQNTMYLRNQLNIHFRSQQFTCDRSDRFYPAGYRYILRMGGDNPPLAAQVKALVRAVGAPESMAAEHFPLISAAHHKTDAAVKAETVYDRRSVQLALELFGNDYVHFQMPYPSWLQRLLNSF